MIIIANPESSMQPNTVPSAPTLPARVPLHLEEPGSGLNLLIIDCAGKSRAELRGLVTETLRNHGAVLMKNTGMVEMAEMKDWADLIGSTAMEYTAGTNSRSKLGGGVLTVGTEPPFVDVAAHNEMSYSKEYCGRIMFGCLAIPSRGGATVIADNRAVTESMLATPTGQRILREGITYIRNFYDADRPGSLPSLRSWQEAFGVDNRGELRAMCRTRSWDLEERSDGSVRVSWTHPGYEYDPLSGSDLLFTSIGNHGVAFDGWQPYQSLPNDERPYHLTFGGGGEFSREDLDEFNRIFNEHGQPIPWEPEMVAVLDNLWWTHARPPYELPAGEQRRIGVKILDPVNRRGQLAQPDRQVAGSRV